MSSKPEQRAHLRALRRALPRELLQQKLNTHLPSGPWTQARTVAGYAALPEEASLDALYTVRPFAFPKTGASTLQFFACPREALIPGRFQGLKEPPPDAPPVSLEAIDVFLVPGLGFTEAGDRLGYGGGFYDRTLARARGLRIGVGFEAQVVERLSVDEHDLRLHGLWTEVGFRWCRT